ncbi:HEAT repeat domain-containing protein [Poritiphilus flavus]|uniref:HEAT repeat domain-containing protein n=1 Tax=Poritiphilus flavus TaxID=2697053 RepID=A0A6L9EEP5_9FLAO|nr:HEAT repeat domain-containing protein [Poritiphilus flavus]NAS13196.1 hypothetical protein [Poritiphilus flavus]
MAKRKKELAPLISNFLFFEDDSSREEKEEYLNLKVQVRELLKEKFNRKALTEILMDLQKDLSGDAQERIYNLYKDLGLHQDAFKKLKSWRWEVISEGILELTQMQVGEAFTMIRKFINHRRGVVRKQAQIATVTLKDEGINYFLDSNKYRISEWQQLKLLDVLRHKEDFEPPRFKAWLTSKNRDVVLFALRLIKYYKQNDAQASLIQLVKHKNNQIKSEAIGCIKEFHFSDAVETLKAVFWRCGTDVKLQLLDAIGMMGSKKDIEFLQSIEKKENNFIVKSKALSAINAISPESIIPSEGILETLEQPDEIAEAPDQQLSTTEDSILREEVAEEQVFETKLEQESPSINPTDIEPDPVQTISDSLDNPDSPDEEILEASQENSEQPNTQETMTPKPSNPKDTKEQHQQPIPDEEHLLDQEMEDEIIFEICFMEDLQDILDEADPEKEAAREVLPLDFLPIVTETDEKGSAEQEADAEASILKNMEVVAEIIGSGDVMDEVLSDEQPFAVREGASEVDFELDFNFLPFVVEEAMDLDNMYSEENAAYKEMEVVFEEITDLTEQPDESIMDVDWELNPRFEKEKLKIGDITAPQQEEDENGSVILEHGRQELSTFSIFQEFFRTCDLESKLILLDEIPAVGEEKELLFVQMLAENEHEDAQLRKKARKTAEILQKMLAKKESDATFGNAAEEEVQEKTLLGDEVQIVSEAVQSTVGILEPDFELAEQAEVIELQAHKEEEDQSDNSNTSIFESFLKIIDKLNG